MYTTEAASQFLKVKPRTVTRYIERGTIRARKYGHIYLIETNELLRYIYERRERGRPKGG